MTLPRMGTLHELPDEVFEDLGFDFESMARTLHIHELGSRGYRPVGEIEVMVQPPRYGWRGGVTGRSETAVDWRA